MSNGYLLDTMVVSEPMKNRADRAVIEWLTAVAGDELFVSVVSVGEIVRGIRKIQAVEQITAERYRKGLQTVIDHFGNRIVPVGLEIMRRWGDLTFELKHTNPDLLIAATALTHDLTIVTRNARHFEPTGAKLFNPYT